MRGYFNREYCEGQGYGNSVTLFIGNPEEIKKLYLDLRELYVPLFSDYPKFNLNKKLYGLLLHGDLNSDTTYKVVTYEQTCEVIEKIHRDLLMFPEDNELYRCSFNDKTKAVEIGEKIACLYNEIVEIEYEAGYDADSCDTTAEHDIHTSKYLNLKTKADIQDKTILKLVNDMKDIESSMDRLWRIVQYRHAFCHRETVHFPSDRPLTRICIIALVVSIFSSLVNILINI